MPFYYYVFLLMLLCVIITSIVSIILWRKNVPVELFIKALRNENKGRFEEAILIYENALMEFKNIRFHNDLKNKIIQKIKLLHTLIEYQKSSVFIR